jgi:hypothetical protein
MRIGQISLALAALLCIVVMSCHSKSPESSSIQEKMIDDQSNIHSKHSSTIKANSPSWNALCSVEGMAFKVRFRSQTGDVTNDDMTSTAEWPDGTVVSIPLKLGWFVPKDEIACGYLETIGQMGIGWRCFYWIHPPNGSWMFKMMSAKLLNLT